MVGSLLLTYPIHSMAASNLKVRFIGQIDDNKYNNGQGFLVDNLKILCTGGGTLYQNTFTGSLGDMTATDGGNTNQWYYDAREGGVARWGNPAGENYGTDADTDKLDTPTINISACTSSLAVAFDYLINFDSGEFPGYDRAFVDIIVDGTTTRIVDGTGSKLGTIVSDNAWHTFACYDSDGDMVLDTCGVPTVPAAPTGLTATVVSANQIDLGWTDNSTDETGFKIESPAGTAVTTTAANAISYSHTGLTCNTTYNYTVKATNVAGDSTAITASATTAACPPASTSTGTPAIPLDPTYMLTIKTSGKGTGMIGYQTSDITGKAVGSLTECSKPEGCTYTLPTTSWIKLTAVPTGDSLFSGFAGNVGQCSNSLIFLTQNTLCNAYFDSKPVPVTTPTTGTTTPPTGTTTPPTGTTTPPTGTTTPPTDTTTPPTDTTTPPTGTTTPPTGTTTPPTETTTPPSTVVIPITPTPDGTSSSSSNSSDGQCLPKNNKLNVSCNANWAILKDFQIQEKGHLSAAYITGKLTIHSTGWAANLKLQGKASIQGGVLTGYITCEDNNVITDMTEFKGSVLRGCTLEGTILNTSRLEGKGLIRDIKLGAKAKVKGGRLGGKITGESKSPASLDWLEIDQGSELSNVKLGKHVSIAPGVKLDDSVQFESSSDK